MRTLRLLLVGFLCTCLSACQPDRVETLRVGVTERLAHVPLLLANSLDALPRDQIKLVQLTSSSLLMHELRNQNLEAAAVTLGEAVQLAAEGLDIAVVTVLAKSTGADTLMAKTGINSITDLKGKRVGVEPTALAIEVLGKALESPGYRTNQLTLIAIPSEQHTAALNSNRVDALLTSEPIATRLQSQGYDRITDTGRLANLTVLDVLVVRLDTLPKQGPHLETLVHAFLNGVNQLEEKPVAANQVLVEKNLGINVFAAVQQVKWYDAAQNRRYLQNFPQTLVNLIKSKQDYLNDKQFLNNRQPLSLSLRPEWLPAL